MVKVCGQYSIKLMLRHTKFPLTHSFTLIKAYAEKLKATLDSQEVRNIIFLHIDVSHYENIILIFYFPNRQLNQNRNIASPIIINIINWKIVENVLYVIQPITLHLLLFCSLRICRSMKCSFVVSIMRKGRDTQQKTKRK